MICKHIYIYGSSHPQGALWKKAVPESQIWKKYIILPKSLKNTVEGAQFQQSCRPKAYTFME